MFLLKLLCQAWWLSDRASGSTSLLPGREVTIGDLFWARPAWTQPLSAIESRQSFPGLSYPGTVVARLNGFVTSVPRREVRGEAAGPKPMLHTFPFVPSLLALPVGVGDVDVRTLGAGADL